MKRIALALLLAAAPAAQPPNPCRLIATHPIYGPFVQIESVHLWGTIELVPTAAGVAMLLRTYYPAGGALRELPIYNQMFGPCPMIGIQLLGWWWKDEGTMWGEMMETPNGCQIPLYTHPTGWALVSPIQINPFIFSYGLKVQRAASNPNDAICPTYAAYLLLPSRGWW